MSIEPKSTRGLRIGLTGGMGCGKSTAAGIFRELGFGVMESDVLVRELWETDTEVKQAAVQRWGKRVIEQGVGSGEKEAGSGEQRAGSRELHTSHSTFHTPHSALAAPHSALSISRRAIANIVFADARELDWLENQLHPRVRARWLAALAAAPARDWVVEIPLLFEKSLASEFDYTLCIASSPALQASRLAARGLTPAEIAARQARQWPLPKKIEQADWVALNDGPVDFLRRQIVQLASRLRDSAPPPSLTP